MTLDYSIAVCRSENTAVLNLSSTEKQISHQKMFGEVSEQIFITANKIGLNR